jgi:cytochrome c-type biogenesis protein CcmH/NrfG
MAAYAGIVLIIFSLGYSISYGPYKDAFGQYIAGKILTQQMALDPENSDLYVLVGDYYYNEKEYRKAREAYENVLRIAPENVHALNNLAWLLATCPDKGFRDGPRSLELASLALELSVEPHILDTYAEALFVNNRFSEARTAARQALALATDKKSYYREQVARFEQAANSI